MSFMETERLILRNWRKSDINDLFEYAKNPNIGPSAGWQPHVSLTATELVLKTFIYEKEIWAITLKESKKVIGSIGLHLDKVRPDINCRMIGYVISEDYWGKGFGTEACEKVTEYAFNVMNLDILSAYHYPDNIKSKRILEKIGFSFEGILRKSQKSFDNTVYDVFAYSILKEEYFHREPIETCLLD